MPDTSILIDPHPIQFGGQAVGTASGIETVVVTNSDRSGPVSIRSVGISGPDALDFAVETNICHAVVVPSHQSCSVDVRFTPTATGTRRAHLRVQRADVSRSVNVDLFGEGLGQPLRIQQSTIDFGQIAVTAASVTKSVVATNVSRRPLLMRDAVLKGDNATDFSLTAVPAKCYSLVLGPGQTCVVNVTFSPTDFGDRNASIVLDYDDPSSPSTLSVSGVGATLSLRVGPALIDFGRQRVGTASASGLVTISTPAGTVVTIGDVTITGPDAGSFKIEADNCSGQTLAPRDSCTVAVAFTPRATGLKLASFAVNRANEVTIVSAVQLSGFGFVPG